MAKTAARKVTRRSLDEALNLHRAGRLQEAEWLYGKILEQRPQDSEALHLFGLLCGQTRRIAQSIDLIRRSIEARPGNAEAWCNLGISLAAARSLDEALAAFRRALELNPDHVAAWFNLGTTWLAKGELAEAILALRKALELKPRYAEAWNSLGTALRDHGDIESAIAALEKAIHLKPDNASVHNNLAVTLTEHARFEDGIMSYRRALELGANFAELHTNFGIALLRLGDFEQGWDEYERRVKLLPGGRRCFTQPRWDGSELGGKRILLHAEQGFGDAIQFLRYVPKVLEKGGGIVLETPAELVRLAEQTWSSVPVAAPGDPLPEFDLHCPLPSLPRLFKTTVTTIPAEVPYLRPDAELVEAWARRLGQHRQRMRIGLAWAGGPMSAGRSIPLPELGPLADAREVAWFSLQKGVAAAEAANPPVGMKLIDCANDLRDFADTAALIANLDLVITVDTAVAHLSGAIGVPVWIMLRHVADWRWLVDREDSPWYPAARLFRQERAGEWAVVVRRIRNCLEQLVR